MENNATNINMETLKKIMCLIFKADTAIGAIDNILKPDENLDRFVTKEQEEAFKDRYLDFAYNLEYAQRCLWDAIAVYCEVQDKIECADKN